jgi:hypothetical protein
LSAAKFTTDGAILRITLSLPEAQVEQFFMDRSARTTRKAAVR